MPEERFYATEIPPIGSQLSLEKSENHHLLNVMRCECGDIVELVDGQGTLATARLESRGKKSTLLTLLSAEKRAMPKQRIIIVQGLPRMNRLDSVVEKSTELGVSDIALFLSDKSEKNVVTPNQKIRLRNVAIAAMKQCGRLYLPQLHFYSSLADALPQLRTLPLFFGSIDGTAVPLWGLLEEVKPKEGCAIAIGAEKGLSTGEEALLQEHGAHAASLHIDTLRTDTASIAAVAIAQQWYLLHN